MDYSYHMYTTILVCSGGKTGSSTLYESIKHYTTRYPDIAVFGATLTDRHTNETASRLMEVATTEKRLLILTSYREPIGRMISSFFQNLEQHLPDLDTEKDDFETMVLKCTNRLDNYFDFQSLTQNYFETYHPMGYPPEFIKDYLLLESPNVDIMWLRFDNIHLWKEQIRTVLPTFDIVCSNVSAQKSYSTLYTYIKNNYRNPKCQYLIESEKHMSQYYLTQEEMDAITTHWCGGSTLQKKDIISETLCKDGSLFHV